MLEKKFEVHRVPAAVVVGKPVDPHKRTTFIGIEGPMLVSKRLAEPQRTVLFCSIYL